MNDRQYKELSIKEFTKAAEIYDSGHAGIYEMCKDDYPPILEELRKDDFENLLDIGCGTGPMIELLVSEIPGKSYTGLDLTPRMIEIASGKGLESATFIVGDAEDLPFENESFDVIICANSFHHYPNPQRFFEEAQRVLRPGGKLVLRDYTAAAPVVWLMNHVEMPLANLVGHGDVGASTLDEVRAFCLACGLVPCVLESQRKFRLHLVARKPTQSEMERGIQFGDIQETALVTLAIRASETSRPNARIRDEKAAGIIAQLGVPDMGLPIQYALTYPKRVESMSERLDFTKLGKGLNFYAPDYEELPCLALAIRCARSGGTDAAVMNAALS